MTRPLPLDAMAALGLVAAASMVAACGSPPPPPTKSAADAPLSGERAFARLVSPARLLALPEAGTSTVETDADGSTRSITHGMRVFARPDGSFERSAQVFPTGRTVKSLRVPERLGGGFLFYAPSGGTTQIWRASTWTSELAPLATLDLEVERIADGFDRFYVIDQRSLEAVALDPASGKPTDAGSLPAAPAYNSMAFADGWMGVVDVPFLGPLVTFDAGSSWRPLGLAQSYGVLLEQGEIVIMTPNGRAVLDASGVLRHRGAGTQDDLLFVGAGRPPGSTASPVDAPAPPEPPAKPAIGPFGKLPLRAATLHGFRDAAQTLVVAKDGALGRVALSDGRLVDLEPLAFPAGGSCDAVPIGTGFGFVCGQERGGTTVYAFEPPLAMRALLELSEPRYVASSGNGALVIRGPCKGKAADAVGAYCVRAANGRLHELRVRGDLGVERVVALSDGRTAVLVPPRLGAPGTLTLVAASGSATTVKLKLPKEDAPTLAILRKGLWLDGFTQRGTKQLAGWVAAAGPFLGVRVELDGTVKAGKIESDIDRAMLSGELGLVLGRSSTASETTDGGFSWNAVDLPADGGDPALRAKLEGVAERGCSRIGCVFGSWLRVGWRGKSGRDDIATVEPPPATALPSSRGGRWRIDCVPTGEVAGPAELPKGRPAPGEEAGVGMIGGVPGGWSGHHRWGVPPPAPAAEELKSSEWTGFLGVAAPPKKAGELGFDLGTEQLTVQAHGYAWGPRGAAWDRVGNFLVRVLDPFELGQGVWSTAQGHSPWGDVVATSQVFGRDMNVPAAWFPVLEPAGRAAALLVNARGTAEILLLEEGRTVQLVQDAMKWGLYQLSGAVKVGSTWYLGSFIAGSSFRLFRVEAGKVVLVREYPLTSGYRPGSNLVANLIRNLRGDALGIWVEVRHTRSAATRWFVYGLHPESGDVTDVTPIEPSALASFPEPCAHGDDGWLLVGDPPLDPYVDFGGAADSVRSSRVQAKLVVRDEGLCVESLAAEADNEVPKQLTRTDVAAWAHGRDTTRMVLHERGRSGRRSGMRCAR